MKKFTCKEMGGVCDEVFEGETAEEVSKKGGDHVMSSTDEVHAPLKEKMANLPKEEMDKWWEWFKGEWDKKEE
jgi:hypothetical protein